MNTTSLFVELVVIGAGVITWVVLLAVALGGYPVASFGQGVLLASAIPVLALVYVFGIVWDRLADTIFNRFWGCDLRARYYSDTGEYYRDRRAILISAPALADLLEYGRSRLRICRGWSLNALLIAISLWLLLGLQTGLANTAILLFASLAALLLSLGCWFAWRNLTLTEYRKIKDQALYLSDSDSKPG